MSLQKKHPRGYWQRHYAMDVRDFGARGNGTTDDTAAIQAAITKAVALGVGRVYAPEGDYLCSGAAIINNTGVHLYGDGIGQTRFLKSGLKNLFCATGTAYANGSNNTLASNAAAGARTITMTAGFAANFSVGQTCILKDEGGWAGLMTAPPRNAEFVTIQAINTGTDVITLWSPIRLAYTTANTARLVVPVQLSDVGYSDFTVVMDDTQDPANLGTVTSDITGYGAAFSGLALYRPVFRDIEVRNSLAAGILLAGCLGARISGYKASDFGSSTTGTGDPTSTDGTGGYGYGICEAELNEGLVATDLEFERIRHGYTSLGGGGMYGNCGVPTGSIIANGVHRDPKDMGWDTHGSGDGITFDNLRVIGGRACGFQMRSRRARILNCSVDGCAASALWIRGVSGTDNDARGNDCFVGNFTATRTNLIDGYPSSLNWTAIGSVVDDGHGNCFDGMRISLSGGPGIITGLITGPIRPTYRNIRIDNPCQVSVTYPYGIHLFDLGSTGDAQIIAQFSNVDIRSTDAAVTHLVYRTNAADRVALDNVRGVGHTGVVFQSATDDGYIDGTVRLTNCDVPTLTQLGPTRFVDDFLGTTIASNWATAVGSNGSCSLAGVTAASNGIIRMNSGADAAGTMATNGTQLSGELSWKASVGGLAIEFRVRMSAITNVAVFIGLTDQYSALEIPFELAALDALTSNATDAAGVLFDTSAATDNWWLVGVKADVDGTKVNSAVAPVANTWERWLMTITSGSTARFYREGILIGSVSNAVTASTRLCPVVAALSRSSTLRSIEVDYIAIEQTRTSTAS